MPPLIEQMAVAYTAEIEELQEQNARLRAMLEWLDRRGGLGLDVHERIKAVLANELNCGGGSR